MLQRTRTVRARGGEAENRDHRGIIEMEEWTLTVQGGMMREVRREERGCGRGRSGRRGGRGCILMSAAPYGGVKAGRDAGYAAEGRETAEIGRGGSDGSRAARVMLKVLHVHEPGLVVVLDLVRLGTPRAHLAVGTTSGRLRADVLLAADDLRGGGAAYQGFRSAPGVVGGRGEYAVVQASGRRSSAGRSGTAGEVDRLGIPRRRAGSVGGVAMVRGGRTVDQSDLSIGTGWRRAGVSDGFQVARVLGQQGRIGDDPGGLLSNRRVRDDGRRPGQRQKRILPRRGLGRLPGVRQQSGDREAQSMSRLGGCLRRLSLVWRVRTGRGGRHRRGHPYHCHSRTSIGRAFGVD